MSTTVPTITSTQTTKKKGLESVVERPFPPYRTNITLSAFNFLFTEMVNYAKEKGKIREILSKFGQDVGCRMLELLVYRDKKQREIQVVRFFQWLQKPAWKMLFGKDAAKIEKDVSNPNQCFFFDMIFF